MPNAHVLQVFLEVTVSNNLLKPTSIPTSRQY